MLNVMCCVWWENGNIIMKKCNEEEEVEGDYDEGEWNKWCGL